MEAKPSEILKAPINIPEEMATDEITHNPVDVLPTHSDSFLNRATPPSA